MKQGAAIFDPPDLCSKLGDFSFSGTLSNLATPLHPAVFFSVDISFD